MLRRLLLAVVLGGLVLSAAQSRAGAQEGIVVVDADARNEFPTGVTFTISFTAPADVEEVRLRYELAPDGTGASAVAECSGAATINCSHTLTSGRGIFVIPGAEITWHWEIEDAAGAITSTPEQLYVHEDTRFDFRTLEEGNVTVYFHSGTEGDAPGVLQAAAETLRDVGALEETIVPFPIKLFLYETAEEMQPAIAPGSGGRGVQVLGEVVYSDTAMVSADVDALDITRHEIAHIVTGEATRGPFGVASWMNEGISVYAQREPLGGHKQSLDSAIGRDRVLSMRELNSSSAGGSASTVGLFYGQSGSIIRYLIETYGEQEFAELLRTFKEGATPDKAFEAVYSFDQLGLENEWRASVGLDAREASATPTPRATPGDEPTRTGQIPASGDDSSNDSGGVETTTVLIIAILGALVVVAGVAAVVVVRQRV